MYEEEPVFTSILQAEIVKPTCFLVIRSTRLMLEVLETMKVASLDLGYHLFSGETVTSQMWCTVMLHDSQNEQR